MDVIRGMVYRNGLQRTCIGIDKGKIVAIKKNIDGKKKDYGNAIIFPAAIDVHVHFREPGAENKEDFFTGSHAAALAGVTCICDMPNNRPATATVTTFNSKAAQVRTKACVDFGLYVGVINGNVESVKCIGYKIFLSKDNEMLCEKNDLAPLFYNVKRTGKPIAVHAELETCISHSESHTLKDHNACRPPSCEYQAIKTLVDENRTIGAHLHVCHVTTSKSVAILTGIASFGVTPHHLLFSYESKFAHPWMGKVNPPLRSDAERQMLFEQFVRGDIPILESDHAPHTISEKEEENPSGMPGVDAMVPIMLYHVKRGVIPVDVFCRTVCSNPGKLFGLSKGSIEIGNDADFMVVDFDNVTTLNPLSKCGWSAYDGIPCIYPKDVFLRGMKIVENGEYISKKNQGVMIP